MVVEWAATSLAALSVRVCTVNVTTSLRIAVLLSGAIALAGCGKSQVASGEKEWKGIFTTADDCSQSGVLSYEECSDAMSKAVTEHEKSAPTYNSLTSCNAKEGDGRCEFTANGKYRPRLLAFLVQNTKPPKAMTLYAPLKGKTGFRDTSGSVYLVSNEALTFSEHAQTMFETHAVAKRK